MPASEHYFETQRTARYYLIGEPSKDITTIFFALHGYGYLAKYFARRFENIKRNDVLIVVPEGLHRFYLDNEHKRVGASWMTREDRLTDISDQTIYLDGLYREMLKHCPNAKRMVVLGFSQGTATAARWVANSTYSINDLVLWGGRLPPDIEPEEIYRISKMDLITALGDSDEYIDQEKFRSEIARLNKFGLKHRILQFTGGHDILPEGLQELISMLRL